MSEDKKLEELKNTEATDVASEGADINANNETPINGLDGYVHANELESGDQPKDPNFTIDIKNELVEKMLNRYSEEKNVETLNMLISAVHTSRMLVPANLNDKGQPVPCFIKNGDGDFYMPIYTNKEQIPQEPKSPVIMNMPYLNVNEMALRPEVNASGIVINPFTNNLILKRPLLEKIASVEQERKENPAPKPKAIKMSEQQYVIFERQQFEHRFLPGKLFKGGAEFIDELLDKREVYIDELFEESYQQKRMYPYLDEEFQVMPLNISEDITLVRLDMPARDLEVGCCVRVYLSWNKKAEEGKYYFLEKSPAKECVLGEMTSDGKPVSHGIAPEEGAELQRIVDLVKGEMAS